MYVFVFNVTTHTKIYTLPLHDALRIWPARTRRRRAAPKVAARLPSCTQTSPHRRRTHRTSSPSARDRKSTRLNSSHANISYAVFCLKKKKRYVLLVLYIHYIYVKS